MIKFAFGFAFCALIYYYFPSEVENVVKKAEQVVHEGAAKAAEATKPKTALDEAIDTVKEKLQ